MSSPHTGRRGAPRSLCLHTALALALAGSLAPRSAAGQPAQDFYADYPTLLGQGWTPPAGWVPPEGLSFPPGAGHEHFDPSAVTIPAQRPGGSEGSQVVQFPTHGQVPVGPQSLADHAGPLPENVVPLFPGAQHAAPQSPHVHQPGQPPVAISPEYLPYLQQLLANAQAAAATKPLSPNLVRERAQRLTTDVGSNRIMDGRGLGLAPATGTGLISNERTDSFKRFSSLLWTDPKTAWGAEPELFAFTSRKLEARNRFPILGADLSERFPYLRTLKTLGRELNRFRKDLDLGATWRDPFAEWVVDHGAANGTERFERMGGVARMFKFGSDAEKPIVDVVTQRFINFFGFDLGFARHDVINAQDGVTQGMKTRWYLTIKGLRIPFFAWRGVRRADGSMTNNLISLFRGSSRGALTHKKEIWQAHRQYFNTTAARAALRLPEGMDYEAAHSAMARQAHQITGRSAPLSPSQANAPMQAMAQGMAPAGLHGGDAISMPGEGYEHQTAGQQHEEPAQRPSLLKRAFWAPLTMARALWRPFARALSRPRARTTATHDNGSPLGGIGQGPRVAPSGAGGR